jgi:alkanesulfonate monooxygenase SsuD/methylene tetrahydromethanopterin reductase-like flavin-dependent oxidoreductase (luciferase family)
VSGVDVLFGTTVIPTAGGRTDPVEDALHAEQLGFDLVTCWDHLHGDTPSFETWTLLTWIASRTERIRIGTNVLGLPYRHPTVTSKMAETLHRLSGGRLILGMGGGGNNTEFRSWGLEARSPGEKVDALQEAIELIRALWTEQEVTYEGFHFRTEEAQLEPKPETPIPIWVGAYGRRSIAVTGRLADGWIPSMTYMPPDRATRMRERLLRAAGEAGRDPGEITCAYNIVVLVQEGAQDPSGRVLAGSPDEVARRLDEIARRGFTCLNLWPRGDRIGGRERLAKEVIPAVRDMLA